MQTKIQLISLGVVQFGGIIAKCSVSQKFELSTNNQCQNVETVDFASGSQEGLQQRAFEMSCTVSLFSIGLDFQ